MRKQVRERYSIMLDFEVCNGCGCCLEICPENVFDPGQAPNTKGCRPPKVIRSKNCLGCRSCYMVCPLLLCLKVKKLEKSIEKKKPYNAGIFYDGIAK
jgi:NAD-dependent dihydropyrimidine dehydrogenase PreA subunit